MAYRGFKDLNWRTAADEILHYKAFDITAFVKNMMDINVDLL